MNRDEVIPDTLNVSLGGQGLFDHVLDLFYVDFDGLVLVEVVITFEERHNENKHQYHENNPDCDDLSQLLAHPALFLRQFIQLLNLRLVQSPLAFVLPGLLHFVMKDGVVLIFQLVINSELVGHGLFGHQGDRLFFANIQVLFGFFVLLLEDLQET